MPTLDCMGITGTAAAGICRRQMNLEGQLQLKQWMGKRKEVQHLFIYSRILPPSLHAPGWYDIQGQIKSSSSTTIPGQCQKKTHQLPPKKSFVRLELTRDNPRTHAGLTTLHEKRMKGQAMLCANGIARLSSGQRRIPLELAETSPYLT